MYYSNCMDALTPYTSCPDKYSRSRLFSRSEKTNFSTKFELQVIVQLSLTYYRHHRCAQLCVKYRLVNLTWHTWTSGLEEWHIRRKTTKQSFSNRPQTSVERSTLSSLGKISQVQKSTPHLCRGICHSSRHPPDVWTLGTSRHVVRFTTLVLGNQQWGETAWVRG